MKKRQFNKGFCLIAVLLITLSAFIFYGTAAEEAPLSDSISEITQVNSFDNDNITLADGYDHGYVPNISTFKNANGAYTVCVYQNDGTLKIIETDINGKYKSDITINKELDDYAAFTKGSDGTYYLLFSAKRLDNDETAIALRLNNYSSDGTLIRSVDMPANASGSFMGIYQLSCGNNMLCENGNFITGYIGREMFSATETGLHHQSSYGFAVDLKTFTQVQVEHPLYTPYTTHSFHQYIFKDGNDFVYVDRGDAAPLRSFHVTKISGGSNWNFIAMGDSFEFKGEYGSNETYSQFGGMVKTSYGYLLVGSYQNSTDSLEITPANIFTQLFSTSDLTTQPEKYLTQFIETDKSGVTNPKAVQISADKIAVPYMISNHGEGTEEMRIAYINGKGELTGEKQVDTDAILPRFGHVFYSSTNDSIDWFSVQNGNLIMHSIKLKNSHYIESTTTATTENLTNPAEESTEETTTQAQQPETQSPTTQTQPNDEPAQRSFFQKIIDFFVGIYNWIVNFFTSLV